MRSDQTVVRTRWRRMGDFLQATVILLRPHFAERTVHSNHDDVGSRSGHADGPLSVRRSHRDRRSARKRSTLSAGQSRLPGLNQSSPIDSAPASRQGSADLKRCIPVHREDEGDAEACCARRGDRMDHE